MKTEVWALLISGLSFGVSFLSVLFNLRKDSKRLQFIIYRADVYSRKIDGGFSKDKNGATQIELVNNGFRAICISHIGGDNDDPLVKKICRLFKEKGNERSAFIFDDTRVQQALCNQDNSYKMIEPGHKVSITLMDNPFGPSCENTINTINKINTVYALDVDGTKYKAHRKIVSKYKEDIIQLTKQNEQA